MLSRTASDLYWMSRYLERAENLARMLDVSYSLSLLPQDRNGGGLDELAMPLLITGTLDAYLERHGELAAERLLSFFALDPDNPASIYSCLAAARCQCPRGTRADHPGHVGEHQRHLAGNARHRRRGHPALWHQSFLRMGEGPLAPVPRRDLRHQHAQRCVPLHPSRNLHRTRRQYLAPARCALPDPGRSGARQGGRGHRARLLPVERAAAGAIRLRGLHRAVPRLAQRAQHRRIAAVARGRATFAAVLHRGTERDPFRPARRQRPAGAAPAAELEARVRYTGIDEVLEQGLHTWITDYILLVRQLANAIHSSYLEAA